MLGLLLQQPLGVAAADDLVTSQLRDEARLWQSKDRDDLAADAWNRLLLGSPRHGEALVSLGLIMARSGDTVGAKEWYVRASRLKSPPPDLGKLAAAVDMAHADEAQAEPVPVAIALEPTQKPRPAPKPRVKASAHTAKLKSESKAVVLAAPVVVAPAAVQVTPIATPMPETQVAPPAPPKPRPSKALPYFPPL